MAPKRKGRAAAVLATAQIEGEGKSSAAAANTDSDTRMSDAPVASAPPPATATSTDFGEDNNGGDGEDGDGDGDGDGDDANGGGGGGGGSGGGGSSVLSKYQAAWSNGVRSKGLFSILLSRLPRDFSYDILSLIMSFDRESRVYTIDTSGHLSSWMIDPNAAIESIRRIAAAGLQSHTAPTAAGDATEAPVFCVINQSLIEPQKVVVKRHTGGSASAKALRKRALKRAKYESVVDTWHETTLLATEQYCVVSANDKHFRLFDGTATHHHLSAHFRCLIRARVRSVLAEGETVNSTKTRALVTGQTDAIPVVRFVERFNGTTEWRAMRNLLSYASPYGLREPHAVCLVPGLDGASAPRLFAAATTNSFANTSLSLYDLSAGVAEAGYSEVVVRFRPEFESDEPVPANVAVLVKAACEKELTALAAQVIATAAELAAHRIAFPAARPQRTSGKHENQVLWRLEDEAAAQPVRIAQCKALRERMDVVIARTTLRIPPPIRYVPPPQRAAPSADSSDSGTARVDEYTHHRIDVTAVLPFPAYTHSAPSAGTSAAGAVDMRRCANWVLVGCRTITAARNPISLLIFDTASYTDVAVYANKKPDARDRTDRNRRGPPPAVPVAGRSIASLQWYTPGRLFLAVTADGFLEAYQIVDDSSASGSVLIVLVSCLWSRLIRNCSYGAPICVAGKLILLPDWEQLRVFRLEPSDGDSYSSAYPLSAEEEAMGVQSAASAWSLEPARYKLQYVRRLATSQDRFSYERIIALSDDCVATTEHGGIRLWDVHQPAPLPSRDPKKPNFMTTLFLSQGIRHGALLPALAKSILL